MFSVSPSLRRQAQLAPPAAPELLNSSPPSARCTLARSPSPPAGPQAPSTPHGCSAPHIPEPLCLLVPLPQIFSPQVSPKICPWGRNKVQFLSGWPKSNTGGPSRDPQQPPEMNALTHTCGIVLTPTRPPQPHKGKGSPSAPALGPMTASKPCVGEASSCWRGGPPGAGTSLPLVLTVASLLMFCRSSSKCPGLCSLLLKDKTFCSLSVALP